MNNNNPLDPHSQKQQGVSSGASGHPSSQPNQNHGAFATNPQIPAALGPGTAQQPQQRLMGQQGHHQQQQQQRLGQQHHGLNAALQQSMSSLSQRLAAPAVAPQQAQTRTNHINYGAASAASAPPAAQPQLTQQVAVQSQLQNSQAQAQARAMAPGFSLSQPQQGPKPTQAPGPGQPTLGNTRSTAPAPWGVPNPLMGSGGLGQQQQQQQLRSQAPTAQAGAFSAGAAAASQAKAQQQRQQQVQLQAAALPAPMRGTPTHQLTPQHTQRASMSQPNHQNMRSTSSGQPTMQQAAVQQQAQVAGRQAQVQQGQQQQQPAPMMRPTTTSGKGKVTLSQEAKQALAKAIWSAIRHPAGEVAPELMAEALRTGLPRHAILNAARVAREREAMKRKGLKPPPIGSKGGSSSQQQQQPQQQQSQQTAMMAQSQARSSYQQQQQPQPQQQTQFPYQQQQQPPQTLHAQQQAQRLQQQPRSPGLVPSVPGKQYPNASSSARSPHRMQAQPPHRSHSPHRQLPQHPKQHTHNSAQQSSSAQAFSVPGSTASLLHHQQQKLQQIRKEQQQQVQLSTSRHRSRSPGPASATGHNMSHSSSRSAKSPSSSSSAAAKARAIAQQQESQQYKMKQAQMEERAKWKRIQHGVFVTQKGHLQAPQPASLGAMVRSSTSAPALVTTGRKRTRDLAAEASLLQSQLLARKKMEDASGATSSSAAQLLDPERYKRVRVEPKKSLRTLDRQARKTRQVVAEGLSKQHKDLHKQLGAHQTEFSKFHRARRGELSKVCKAIRDSFDKEEKKKEKDAANAEKARLAALKANDMTAYSKLLEETRNDRLKFLLEKTEKQFTQISTLLQQRQSSDEEDGNTNPKVGTSYYATAHMKTEEVRQPSILVGGDLKEYQMMGLQWLVSLYNNNLNGILADEMGLGKTIQAISLVTYLMEFKQNLGPFLIIVPLSTLSNWQNEFAKWCPSCRVVCYKGLPVQRKEIYRDQIRTGQFNVLLTTYEYIIRDKKYLRPTEWQYAIVDEGHRMKNAESKFAVTLASQYTTKHRILLTGTPLMNDLSELWSLLNFLLPTVFNSVETFDQWFSRPFAQFDNNKNAEESTEDLLSNEERILIIHRLHELLRPFMLRRVKSEVLDQLPEKVEKVLRCDLSSWQKELYKQISRKATTDASIMAEQAPTRGLNNVVMQLRKVCNHPYLFTPEGYHINDTLIRSSGKLALLDQMLPKLKLAGHRILIFTQMTAVMTILEDYFALRGFLSLRLDGSTPSEEREKRMYKFNSPDSPYFIFLLSTRAGGLGLNLTSADTVIIFDSDWNPAMDLQAQDRAHRIGQRASNVSVFRLVTNSPVEEKILSRATEKLNVSELVVESGKFSSESVESDNSLERKKMMEVLLTDFDGAQPKGPSEKSASEDGDDDNVEGEGEEKEDLNELLSNNEVDFAIYAQFDEDLKYQGKTPCELFVGDKNIPDWILNPTQPGAATGNFVVQDLGNTSRKRKDVQYDDGLTEQQFLTMMEKKFEEEDEEKKPAKKKAKTGKSGAQSDGDEQAETGLTDWTFRKFITLTKSVVALKEPGTKRKISEIFLEKPDPATFPDYYEIIEKPIAINDILRKCRGKVYADLQEFKADWTLMFSNARKFNGDDSWVVEDAKALEKELERVLKKNGFSATEVPVRKNKKLRIKLSLKDVKSAGS